MGCTIKKDRLNFDFNKIYKNISNKYYLVRELEAADYYRGFIETLMMHFDLHFPEFPLSAEKFGEIFTDLDASSHIHKIIVVEDRKAEQTDKKIIGTGTIYIKPIFFSKIGPIAHIEDIALRYSNDSETATRIIKCLINIAIANACSKILVTSKIYNKPFYRDYGFVENGAPMEYHLNVWDHRNMRKSITTPIECIRKNSYESQGIIPAQQHVKYDKLNISYEQSVEPPQ